MPPRTQLTRLASPHTARRSILCVVLLGALVGCSEAAPRMLDEPASPVATSPFAVHPDAGLGLLAHVHSSTLRICLEGSGVNPTTSADYGARILHALNTWIAAVRPAANVPLEPKLTLTCVGTPDLTVDWSAEKETPGVCGALKPDGVCHWESVTDELRVMHLLSSTSDRTLLHEMGHAFGLGDTYVVDAGDCQPGQRKSLMCDDRIGHLTPDDELGVQQAFCGAHPTLCKQRIELEKGFCTGDTEYFLTGDFNGDRRTDLLCHDAAAGHQRILLASGRDFVDGAAQGYVNTRTSFCADDRRLLVGDLDADGRAELLCHDAKAGTVQTASRGTGGALTVAPTPAATDFCRAPGWAWAGDFNGDRRVDLLCRQGTGALSTTLASARGTYEKPVWTTRGWCAKEPRVELADFDADGRTDVLCHSGDTAPSIVYATPSGGLATATPSNAVTPVAVGDITGDGRADALGYAGDSWWNVTYASTKGTLSGISRWWLSSLGENWDTETLRLGDVDGDKTADLVCHDRASGRITVVFQTPVKNEE